jgi:hypothetical protein
MLKLPFALVFVLGTWYLNMLLIYLPITYTILFVSKGLQNWLLVKL